MSISWAEIDDDDESDYANVILPSTTSSGLPSATAGAGARTGTTPTSTTTRYSRASETQSAQQSVTASAPVVARATGRWKQLGGSSGESGSQGGSSTPSGSTNEGGSSPYARLAGRSLGGAAAGSAKTPTASASPAGGSGSSGNPLLAKLTWAKNQAAAAAAQGQSAQSPSQQQQSASGKGPLESSTNPASSYNISGSNNQGGAAGSAGASKASTTSWRRSEEPPETPSGSKHVTVGSGMRLLQRTGQEQEQKTQGKPQQQQQAPPPKPQPQVVISQEREMGVIQNLPEGNKPGKIYCMNRPTSIPFTLADLRPVTSEDPEKPAPAPVLEIGTEFEFNVKTVYPSGEMSAVDITLLPKGTVKFDEILQENAIGVIVAHLQGAGLKQIANGQFKFSNTKFAPGEQRPELYGGAVAVVAPIPEGLTEEEAIARNPGWSKCISLRQMPRAAASKVRSAPAEQSINVNAPYAYMFTGERYEFSERDLRNPLTTHPGGLPLIGDVVMFSIFRENRTGHVGATQISVIDPEPTNRRRGIVKVVYPPSPEHPDGFGFIHLFRQPGDEANTGGREGRDNRDEIYFKPADLLVPGTLTAGSAVSFTLVSIAEQLAALSGTSTEKGRKAEDRCPRAYRIFPIGRVGTQRRLLRGVGVDPPILADSTPTSTRHGKDETKSGKKRHEHSASRGTSYAIRITGLAEDNIDGAAPEPPTASDIMTDDEMLALGTLAFSPIHHGSGPSCVLPGDEVTMRVFVYGTGQTMATDVRLHSLDASKREIGVIVSNPEGSHPGQIRCLGRKGYLSFYPNSFATESELNLLRSMPGARPDFSGDIVPGMGVEFNVVTEGGSLQCKRIRLIDPALVQFTTSFYALGEVLAIPCSAESGAPNPTSQLEVKLVLQAGDEDLNVAVEAASQQIASSRRPDLSREMLKEELVTWHEKVPAWYKPDPATRSYIVKGAHNAFGYIPEIPPTAMPDTNSTNAASNPSQLALPGDIVIVRVTCDNETETATVTDSLLVLPSIACSHRGVVIATSAPPPGERHRYGYLVPVDLAHYFSTSARYASECGMPLFQQPNDICQIRFSFADVAPSMRSSIVPGCQVRFSLLRHAPSTIASVYGIAGPSSERSGAAGDDAKTGSVPQPSTPVFVPTIDLKSPLATRGMVLSLGERNALGNVYNPSPAEAELRNGLFQAVRVVPLTAGDAALYASLTGRSPLLSAYAKALSQHSILDERVYQLISGTWEGYVESLPTLVHSTGALGPVVRQEPGYLALRPKSSTELGFTVPEPPTSMSAQLARMALERVPPGSTAEAVAQRRKVAALVHNTPPDGRRIPFFFSSESVGLDIGDSVRFSIAIMPTLLPTNVPLAAQVTCLPKRGVVAESHIYLGPNSPIFKLKRIFVTVSADPKNTGSDSGLSYTEAFAVPPSELALFPSGLAADDCVEFKRVIPAGSCQYDSRVRSAAGIVRLPRGSVTADIGMCLANNEAQRALYRAAAATAAAAGASSSPSAPPMSSPSTPNLGPTPSRMQPPRLQQGGPQQPVNPQSQMTPQNPSNTPKLAGMTGTGAPALNLEGKPVAPGGKAGEMRRDSSRRDRRQGGRQPAEKSGETEVKAGAIGATALVSESNANANDREARGRDRDRETRVRGKRGQKPQGEGQTTVSAPSAGTAAETKDSATTGGAADKPHGRGKERDGRERRDRRERNQPGGKNVQVSSSEASATPQQAGANESKEAKAESQATTGSEKHSGPRQGRGRGGRAPQRGERQGDENKEGAVTTAPGAESSEGSKKESSGSKPPRGGGQGKPRHHNRGRGGRGGDADAAAGGTPSSDAQ